MTIATLKIVFWALAFVFFVVCEVATGTALVSIWLAIAALIAMFCAIAKLSFLTQCIVFVVSSIILLLLTRPVVKKLQNKTVATNYELDVGKTAIVIEPIDNSVNKRNTELTTDDKILVLSTCLNSGDGRYLVQGVLKKDEPTK